MVKELYDDPIMQNLWNAIWANRLDIIKEHFEKEDTKINERIGIYGSEQSLVFTAMKSGNMEIVDYLLSIGEYLMDDELDQLKKEKRELNAKLKVLNYFEQHEVD